ncbi:2897_t:CDS:2 [Cetraspora pellucida]|uniref:2897_t:CDS:1 n=1 Tax=Cetraspora pellucida TaxID=1433469 RepID=A0ACA9M6B9_9GLOM|nr:2897_t:CDS:2 [Cetraspora pellucida]
MNQKYFIISFTLLVFFFLIHVEKTHGSHPKGEGCGDGKRSDCDAKITAARPDKLLTKRLDISEEVKDPRLRISGPRIIPSCQDAGITRPPPISDGCGAKITDASWTILSVNGVQNSRAIGAYLNMTVTTPEGKPRWIGDVSFSYDNGIGVHIIDKLEFIDSPQNTFFWTYPYIATPKNVWADVWATILWNCEDGHKCASEFVHLRTWVPA